MFYLIVTRFIVRRPRSKANNVTSRLDLIEIPTKLMLSMILIWWGLGASTSQLVKDSNSMKLKVMYARLSHSQNKFCIIMRSW